MSQTPKPPPLPRPAKARLTRELHLLSTDPPPGIAAYLPTPSDMSHIRAQITGPEQSPFSKGIFLVTVNITVRYPFEPPRVRFITPVYHPNIDNAGRICLDTLKSPPAGSWSPAVSLPSLLLSLRSLLAEPNPDDGLVPEISDLYKKDPEGWAKEATKWTEREANPDKVSEMEGKLDGLVQPAQSAAKEERKNKESGTEGRGEKRTKADVEGGGTDKESDAPTCPQDPSAGLSEKKKTKTSVS